ncbi:hypothetical protein PAXINDRAFT_101467 [Paxillus involutus ATCC 200175]|uniref:Uncharacterized protein n=1 Tax=Paxillus involutus ATCC 200175 TaxID=664439 RepID=A0A0C9TMR3_PAXIN|nr:hypothetical protein PAXINDRAFT_101467 [Paxillus involutus ATCC 200175]
MALQVVKDLFFVGKWFITYLPELGTEDTEEEEEEEKEGEGENIIRLKNERQDTLPAVPPANWALSPLSILRFFAAMTSYMEAKQLERFLPHMLTPLYRITEEDTIRDSGIGRFECATRTTCCSRDQGASSLHLRYLDGR